MISEYTVGTHPLVVIQYQLSFKVQLYLEERSAVVTNNLERCDDR